VEAALAFTLEARELRSVRARQDKERTAARTFLLLILVQSEREGDSDDQVGPTVVVHVASGREPPAEEVAGLLAVDVVERRPGSAVVDRHPTDIR
jgi:hypothetical protein